MSDQNTLNALIQDLIDLIPASDPAVAFWASESLNQLTRLRALAAERGFVHWSLANSQLLGDDPTLKPVLKSALGALQKLGELLEHASIRKEADSESTGAASRIYGTVQNVQSHPVVQ